MGNAGAIQFYRQSLITLAIDIEVVLSKAEPSAAMTEDAVRFPAGSAVLNEVASRNVSKIALVLREVLPTYASCAPADGAACDPNATSVETVFVEGHTDVTGTDDTNWQLSTQRAVTTYRLMTDAEPLLRGLTNRAKREIISVSGYSSTRPVIDEANTAAYDSNRRIDLRFVMEIEDGKRLQEVLALTDEMEGQLQNLRSAIDAANVQ